MNLEGRVMVDLSDGAFPHVSFQQPGTIANLLVGQTPDKTVSIIPRVYTLCALAQTHASTMAVAAAEGETVPLKLDTARQALIAGEAVREHVLRIMLDWPAFLGKPPAGADAAPMMKLTENLSQDLFGASALSGAPFLLDAEPASDSAEETLAALEAFLAAKVFGCELADFLAIDRPTAFKKWARETATLAAGFIANLLESSKSAPLAVAPFHPHLSLEAMFRAFNTQIEDFGRLSPTTTTWDRHANHPLMQAVPANDLLRRHVARLIELASLPQKIRALAMGDGAATATLRTLMVGANAGASRVETARGDLAHMVRIANGTIADYRIIPPTYWNFRENGIAASCLRGLSQWKGQEKERAARMVINAIDPCVGYQLRMA